MKLTRIVAQNFIGARSIDIDLSAPINLLAGANGAGKSSVRDAISVSFTGDLCRVSKKGDAAALISEGATAAVIDVFAGLGDYHVAINKSGKISCSGPESHPAMPFLIDPARFARLDASERRAFLFDLLGIETSHKAIAERMTRRGLDADKIAAVLPVLRAGFAAGERHAKEQAAQARGAWKAVAGEAYGDKKAEGWQPPVPDAPANAAALAENADAQAKTIDAELARAQQEIGAARQAASAREAEVRRINALREKADMVSRIKDRLATAEENVANCRAQLVQTGAEDPKAPGSYLLRGLASVTDEMLTVLGYHDGNDGLKTRASTHLAEYRKLHGDPHAEPDDPAREAEIRRGLQTAESGAANARRDLAAAEAAAAELADLAKTAVADVGSTDTSVIEARINDLAQRRSQWQADARRYRDAVSAAERRAGIIEQAARHHADVQQWSVIADALSPDGIQAEMIADALAPMNDALAAHAGLAQWAVPRVGADMAITAGGRLYGLLSESERWRTDALIAVTIAELSGLRFAVLDRLDVLDAAGREDALYWLSDLAEAGKIDTVIVLATLRAAPPAAALPPHIAARWIERGVIDARIQEAA